MVVVVVEEEEKKEKVLICPPLPTHPSLEHCCIYNIACRDLPRHTTFT